MKIARFGIMLLSTALVMGCQSSPAVDSNIESNVEQTGSPKAPLFRTSDQTDSSQGTALPTEPVEKDPTQVDAIQNRPRPSTWIMLKKSQSERRRGVNPESTPAMESNSIN